MLLDLIMSVLLGCTAEQALGLTQAQLAERLGVDPSVLCRDERNDYHDVTLERAAKILPFLDHSTESPATARPPWAR